MHSTYRAYLCPSCIWARVHACKHAQHPHACTNAHTHAQMHVRTHVARGSAMHHRLEHIPYSSNMKDQPSEGKNQIAVNKLPSDTMIKSSLFLPVFPSHRRRCHPSTKVRPRPAVHPASKHATLLETDARTVVCDGFVDTAVCSSQTTGPMRPKWPFLQRRFRPVAPPYSRISNMGMLVKVPAKHSGPELQRSRCLPGTGKQRNLHCDSERLLASGYFQRGTL